MEQKTRKRRVCFVSPKAYPIFNPEITRVFGGAEVDLYMIATELAKDSDFDVSFIVADYGQPDEEIRENVRILKSVNFQQNLITGAFKVWAAMKKADADWYMLETASPGVPLALLFTRLHKRKMLYRTAHKDECDQTYLKENPFVGRLFIYSLKRVQPLIVQNQQDQKMVEENYGVTSVVIPNGHRIPTLSGTNKQSILWVGRSAEFKKPERFLQLAKVFPEEKFIMICQQATGDCEYAHLKKKAQEIANLEFIERIPFAQVDRFFENAKIYVNTSDSEGFPNTYVQACKNSTAILSYGVNPDHFIDEYDCGAACEFSRNKMEESLRTMLADNHYIRLGRNGQQYAIAKHDIGKITEHYKQFFRG